MEWVDNDGQVGKLVSPDDVPLIVNFVPTLLPGGVHDRSTIELFLIKNNRTEK
jgi:hypothetical protein